MPHIVPLDLNLANLYQERLQQLAQVTENIRHKLSILPEITYAVEKYVSSYDQALIDAYEANNESRFQTALVPQVSPAIRTEYLINATHDSRTGMLRRLLATYRYSQADLEMAGKYVDTRTQPIIDEALARLSGIGSSTSTAGSSNISRYRREAEDRLFNAPRLRNLGPEVPDFAAVLRRSYDMGNPEYHEYAAFGTGYPVMDAYDKIRLQYYDGYTVSLVTDAMYEWLENIRGSLTTMEYAVLQGQIRRGAETTLTTSRPQVPLSARSVPRSVQWSIDRRERPASPPRSADSAPAVGMDLQLHVNSMANSNRNKVLIRNFINDIEAVRTASNIGLRNVAISGVWKAYENIKDSRIPLTSFEASQVDALMSQFLRWVNTHWSAEAYAKNYDRYVRAKPPRGNDYPLPRYRYSLPAPGAGTRSRFPTSGGPTIHADDDDVAAF